VCVGLCVHGWVRVCQWAFLCAQMGPDRAVCVCVCVCKYVCVCGCAYAREGVYRYGDRYGWVDEWLG